MVFSSIFFLFTFLPISLTLYFTSPKKFKNITLLLISLFFYAWGEPIYVLLMITSILVNFNYAIFIEKLKIENKLSVRKVVFFTAVIFNILIIGFFKYFGFITDNINLIFNTSIVHLDLPLPIGISFYTFQVLSYIIDIYLGKVKLQKNLISFSLYVTMFPQLIAGPIVRYSDIDSQLEKREISSHKFGEGSLRFIQGLGKKVLIANNMGALWNSTYSLDISTVSSFSVWIGVIAYTFQIYFDFSGYSDMAIGLGKMFGFEFIENFNYPYISKSVTEFWRRWHISLGTWFREYLYIPLGGNRCSKIKQARNIMTVWILTGLWHGASWNFVIWGIYYGVILLIEKLFLKRFLDSIPSFFSHIYCMILVIIGWVFFAIEDMAVAKNFLHIMSGFSSNPVVDSTSLYYFKSYGIMLIISFVFCSPLLKNIFSINDNCKNKINYIILVLFHIFILIMCTAYLVTETYNPFLYFRF